MLKLEALGYISNYHNTAESLTKLSEIELHCETSDPLPCRVFSSELFLSSPPWLTHFELHIPAVTCTILQIASTSEQLSVVL